MKELEDFDRRYAEKMVLPLAMDMASQQQMTSAMAAYPGLGDAMGKLDVEKVKMDGTAVLTSVRFEAVGTADQTAPAAQPKPAPAAQPKPALPTSLGGLLGGLGKKPAAKTEEKAEAKDSSTPGAIMTTNHELVSVSSSVSDSDVSIPAGFKERK
jgi:hypothetical protein